MTSSGKALGLGVAAWVLAGAGPAAAAPDARKGETIAKRWCAECHVIAPGQTTGNPDVPSFSTIAANPERTPEQLAALLAAPEKVHSRMQNLSLSRDEIADLIAYIKTRKP